MNSALVFFSDGKVVWTNSEEASNYAEARPDYPPDVVEISMEYLRYKYKGPLTAALGKIKSVILTKCSAWELEYFQVSSFKLRNKALRSDQIQ